MARVMTEAHKAKLRKTVEARSAAKRANREAGLEIDGYRVFRADELNWSIIPPNRPGVPQAQTYYNDLPSALKTLMRQRISEDSATSILEILKRVDAAEAAVLLALKSHTLIPHQNARSL